VILAQDDIEKVRDLALGCWDQTAPPCTMDALFLEKHTSPAEPNILASKCIPPPPQQMAPLNIMKSIRAISESLHDSFLDRTLRTHSGDEKQTE
jgi:hypothetical protein